MSNLCDHCRQSSFASVLCRLKLNQVSISHVDSIVVEQNRNRKLARCGQCKRFLTEPQLRLDNRKSLYNNSTRKILFRYENDRRVRDLDLLQSFLNIPLNRVGKRTNTEFRSCFQREMSQNRKLGNSEPVLHFRKYF